MRVFIEILLIVIILILIWQLMKQKWNLKFDIVNDVDGSRLLVLWYTRIGYERKYKKVLTIKKA